MRHMIRLLAMVLLYTGMCMNASHVGKTSPKAGSTLQVMTLSKSAGTKSKKSLKHVELPEDVRQAIMSGDSSIQTFFEKNPEYLEARSRYFEITPLGLACKHGHVRLARTLLALNADPNGLSGSKTPLHMLCENTNRHDDILILLLAQGARRNRPDANGLTPLHVAARFGHSSYIKILLQDMKKEDAMKAVDAKCLIFGRTPLGEALLAPIEISLKVRKKVARRLLKRNADLLILNNKGQNIPEIFADSKNSQALRYPGLVEFVRDITKKYLAKRKRALPIDVFIEIRKDGKNDKIDEYIKAGGDVNTTMRHNKETPLICAAKHNSLIVVSKLLQAGARRDSRDSTGKTALDWARMLPNGALVVDELS